MLLNGPKKNAAVFWAIAPNQLFRGVLACDSSARGWRGASLAPLPPRVGYMCKTISAHQTAKEPEDFGGDDTAVFFKCEVARFE